jgi:hypothetical protein
MISFDQQTPTELEWKQESAFGRYFELKGGENVYASIEFVKKFGSLAEAKTAAGGWSFKRRGMLSPTIAARPLGGEDDIALYKPTWSARKGELSLPGGQPLRFEATSLLGKEWYLTGAEGEPLLRFITRGVMKHGAEVRIEPAGRARADLPLLLCLCWYLIELYRLDAEAGATAGAIG